MLLPTVGHSQQIVPATDITPILETPIAEESSALDILPVPNPSPGDKILEPGRTKLFAGLYIGLSVNAHAGGFTLVEDGVTCCQFDGGGSAGGIIGARGDYFMERDSRYGFSGRISYEGRGSGFNGDIERTCDFGQG